MKNNHKKYSFSIFNFQFSIVNWNLPLLFFLLIPSFLFAQHSEPFYKSENIIQKKLNFGFRIGVSTLSPEESDIYQGSEFISSTRATNSLGFNCSAFLRFNIQHIFIQPDISYCYTKEKLNFGYSNETSDTKNFDFQQKSKAFSGAVLVGYNIVKNKSYLFNLFAGPNFKCTFNNKYYLNGLSREYSDNATHFNPSAIIGISANSTFLYFDFRYEFSYNGKTEIYFKDFQNITHYPEDIIIKNNKNFLSFSIGGFF